jgi:hypothetical protein
MKARARRGQGEALEEMKERGERRGQGGDQRSKGRDALLKLSDLGITAKEARRNP